MHPRAKSPTLNLLLSFVPFTHPPLFCPTLWKRTLSYSWCRRRGAAPTRSGLALNTSTSPACSSPGRQFWGPEALAVTTRFAQGPPTQTWAVATSKIYTFCYRFTLYSDHLSAVTLLLHLFYHPMLPSSPACSSKPLCAHRVANYILNQDISL